MDEIFEATEPDAGRRCRGRGGGRCSRPRSTGRPATLDSGALIAIERHHDGTLARRVLFETSTLRPPLLSTVILAQAWRRSSRRHGLSALHRGDTPVDFTDEAADQVGALPARSRTRDVRDGEYVEIAAGPVVELAQPFPVRLDVPSLLG